jgi:hypothetical protein
VSDLRCALGTLTSASVRTNSGAIMADVPHVSRGAGAEEQTLALHLFASPRERVFTYMRRAYQAHYSMDTTLSQRAAVLRQQFSIWLYGIMGGDMGKGRQGLIRRRCQWLSR